MNYRKMICIRKKFIPKQERIGMTVNEEDFRSIRKEFKHTKEEFQKKREEFKQVKEEFEKKREEFKQVKEEFEKNQK